MSKDPADEIVISALIKRFTDQRLPRALEIEKRVLTGKTLTDSDLSFLELVLKDAKYILQFSDKYPQYQELVSKGVQLYTDITQKALKNEKKNKLSK